MKKILLAILCLSALTFAKTIINENFFYKSDGFSMNDISGNLMIQTDNAGDPLVKGSYTFKYIGTDGAEIKKQVEDGKRIQTCLWITLKVTYANTLSSFYHVALYPDKSEYTTSWSKLLAKTPSEHLRPLTSFNGFTYLSEDKAKEALLKTTKIAITGVGVIFEYSDGKAKSGSAGANEVLVEGNGSINSFYIGKYEVTQKEWRDVMGINPSQFQGDNLPVEMVSWDDCQVFITKLNAKIGKKYRLPTEAEWEFAAKGGKKSKGYEYAGSNDIDPVGWYLGNNSKTTHSVGQKQPNELGIYDMTGNVWEWCQDLYNSSDKYRVYRGGGWDYGTTYCRVAYRSYTMPDNRYNYLGFRLVRDK